MIHDSQYSRIDSALSHGMEPGIAPARFLQTVTLRFVDETGRIFFHPFLSFILPSLSAVAVLLVAPLLCDGEPNPSRGGGGGGGRGGGGEYTFFCVIYPTYRAKAAKTVAALSFELDLNFEDIFRET